MMLTVRRSYLLIIALSSAVSAHNATSGWSTSSCINEEEEDLNRFVVYVGWPHKIVCNQLTDALDVNYYYQYDMNGTDQVVCKIWSANDSLLFEKTTTYNDLSSKDGYLLPDMKEGDPVNFTLQLFVSRLGKCVSRKIPLQLKPFEQITCEDYLDKNNLAYLPTSINSTKIYNYEVDASTYPKIYTESMTYKWTRNCSDIPKDLVNGQKDLQIKKVGFEDPGLYACAVTYKGMTRYTTQDNLCVEYPPSFNKQIMSCYDPNQQKNLGQNVSFEGIGNFGEGTFTSMHVSFHWKKQFPNGSSTHWEQCFQPLQRRSFIKRRIYCVYTIEQKPCFYHIATEEERRKTDFIIPFRLSIKNIQESDYGTYVIQSITKYQNQEENIIVTLSANPIPGQQATIIVVGGCAITLLIILAVMAIITYKFSLYIKIHWKRIYGAYETEERQFGAYMAYHFSDKIDKFAAENIRESVNSVRQRLEDMRYTIYDGAKDGFQSPFKAENIESMICKSHRIIIFLTLDYVKDHWSLQELQKGVEEMVRSGTKLIFILHPGIKEYLKQHRNDKKNSEKTDISDTCLLVERAIYLNYAIQWTNDSNFNSKLFNLSLELAMPKLRSKLNQKTERFLSTSSNGFDSLYDYKNIKFERGFSNETQFTEIYIPDAHIVDSTSESDLEERCKLTHL